MMLSIRSVKRLVPPAIKWTYWRWKQESCRLREWARHRPYVSEIDLGRALMGGEGGTDAGSWAEWTGEMRRASMLLSDSPHVAFLKEYKQIGAEIFVPEEFKKTAYYKNALRCVELVGNYFGQTTVDGIRRQAQTFTRLYERLRDQDLREVEFPSPRNHSARRTLPVVRRTLTPGTVQIVNGHHRLAVYWVMGQERVRARVLGPRPTTLQSLVLAVTQTAERRELYQPIDGPEFDHSWDVVRKCEDRLAMMLRFLREHKRELAGLSVLDIGCSYGWFVKQFSDVGCVAMGVERDPTALKIGQIAYGLQPAQLVQSDIQAFLKRLGRRYDVVLFLSILHHFILKAELATVREVLHGLDAVAGDCLFLDMGQNHEAWWRESLREWDDQFVMEFLRQNTSFRRILPLGRDSDNVGPYKDDYRRMLFACVRG